MAIRKSKRLVVDASIARAAGGTGATHPTSKHCRDFLKSILDICHHIVVTPAIKSEWGRHRSRFSHTWLQSMVARKKVFHLNDSSNNELRSKILNSTDTKTTKIILKDLPLIEAAMMTDNIVVSLDENVRKHFNQLAKTARELKNTVWVNPDKIEDGSIPWLENGAKAENKRLLGFVNKNKLQ